MSTPREKREKSRAEADLYSSLLDIRYQIEQERDNALHQRDWNLEPKVQAYWEGKYAAYAQMDELVQAAVSSYIHREE